MGVDSGTIHFKDVSIAYREFLVVDRFCLTIKSGEVVCLFGPSGCGKSSLVKAAIGAVSPAKGKVQLDDKDASEYPSPVSYMPQENELFRWLNVRDNVDLWHRESARRTKSRTGISTDEALKLVELTDAVNKMPFELSGGMARRAALARCLATHARIMLLDEPFTSIERRLRRKVMAVVRGHLKQHGMMAAFVSHDYEEATFMSDRIVFLTAVPSQVSRIAAVALPEKRNVDLFDSDLFRQAMMKIVSGDNGDKPPALIRSSTNE